MSDCRKAIELCVSLHTFRCTEANVIPAFLKALQDKPNLKSLRIYGSLTTEQINLVSQMDGLNDVFLEYANWRLVDRLPVWFSGMAKTLTTIVLYVSSVIGPGGRVFTQIQRSSDLNQITLEAVLKELPDLRGLHVVQCPPIDQTTLLELLQHTPALESLSLTTLEKSRSLPPTIPLLPSLAHIAIDARYSMTSSPTPNILNTLLDLLKASAPNLIAFTLKLPERTIVIQHSFIDKLVDVYGNNLKKLAFLDASLELESIGRIAEDCPLLERLDVAIPIRDVVRSCHFVRLPLLSDIQYAFASLLTPAESLTTLVDVDAHAQHGVRPSLNLELVEHLMESVPTLRTVVSDRRVWVSVRIVIILSTP